MSEDIVDNNIDLNNIIFDNIINNLKYDINNKDKEINDLKNEIINLKKINEEQNTKIINLQNQLNNANNININSTNLIKSLQNIIKIKEQELIVLRGELHKNINNLIDFIEDKKKLDKEQNQLTSVNFISTDQNINCSISCSENEVFALIEDRLYDKYPEYRKTNNYFIFQGKQILRFKTIAQNKIKIGLPVTLITSQDEHN